MVFKNTDHKLLPTVRFICHKNAYLGDLIFFLCRYHYSMILESLVHSSNASNNQKKLAKSFGELKIVVSATFHWNAANKDVTKHLEKGSSV